MYKHRHTHLPHHFVLNLDTKPAYVDSQNRRGYQIIIIKLHSGGKRPVTSGKEVKHTLNYK